MNYIKLEEEMRTRASKLLGGAWTRNANNDLYATELNLLRSLYRAAGDSEMVEWIEVTWGEKYNDYKASGGRARWREL